ncbi:MAG: LysM peptidoglycan-binding domain-containing protein [Ignavibacteria bacterium]|nr:LysM peptidoglycan-binding domain-containing protein [Ignavibacteria bacterium]
MKKFLKLVGIIGCFALINLNFLWAQKPDEELTKEEAAKRIAEFQSIVNDLQSKVQALDNDIDRLKKELDETNKKLQDCLDGYLGLLGVNPETGQPFTKDDVEKFKQRIGTIEGKVREMQRLSDNELANRRKEVEELEKSLNQLRMIKLAVLPEFFDKIISLASDIRGLYREPTTRTYKVGTWAEDRDCLWNIAGKVEIFGDYFLWPKIWQANADIIKNPDLIYPGQILQIPPAGPKTPEEIKAERNYWRKKKEQMEEQKTKDETQ